MSNDYPDWTRLFYLVGTSITIPINIEASDIILPVSIDAATAQVDVNLAASDITVSINIAASDITLDVNIAAQVANIEFEFADQSVAVFDAAKWFAHEAQQVFMLGGATLNDGAFGVTATRLVAGATAYFVTWLGGGVNYTGGVHVVLVLRIDTVEVLRFDGVGGHGTPLDTPIRVEVGERVDLYMTHYSGAQAYCVGSFGGYDEV